MAAVRTPRASWIEEGMRALAAGGPEAVRVETLAHALGVTKGGFYWHFEDRRALLEEMLETWERVVIDEVIERVERGGGDARARLRRLFALAAGREVGRGGAGVLGREFMRIELAIRDWARREDSVARRLRRVDNRRMRYMRSLFAAFCSDEEEIESRCLIAFSLFIGSHFIAAEHRRHRRAQVLAYALRSLEA